MTKRDLLIIGPPPTPNGDLHIGHIAGPYISADVLRRWRRNLGQKALFVTGTDDSQTYVVASAAKAGMSPEDLSRSSTRKIQESLTAAQLELDGFAPYDEGYKKTVRAFLDPLYAAGYFKLVQRNLPYDLDNEVFLVEGLISGDCPRCLAPSRGALCETCGMPLECETLLNLKSTLDPSATVVLRESPMLVFPLESVRNELEAYYTHERLSLMRPAAASIIRRVLSGPLPEFPITYPLDWGISVEYEEVKGQVFNAWAEGMPASMYCTAAAGTGIFTEGMESWQTHDTDLVYFLGLDNVYFWGMSHLALLMAHRGRYMLPSAILSNHFYELEDEKISTSRGHVVYTEDLLQTHSAAAVRFYLCWTAPEQTEKSFSVESMERITGQRLIEPWNTVFDHLASTSVDSVDISAPTELGERLAGLMRADIARHFDLNAFSVAAASRCIAKHASRLAKDTLEMRSTTEDLQHQFRLLHELADPILKLRNNISDVGMVRLSLDLSAPSMELVGATTERVM